jgi:hypothetical protein
VEEVPLSQESQDDAKDQDAASAPAEPDPAEVLELLHQRLGEDGIRKLVADCLRATDRLRAVQLINASVGAVKLSASADRGRMGRILAEGLARRRAPVLEVIQTLSRDPFEMKADQAAKERLDKAVDTLNTARGKSGAAADKKKHAAASEVAAAIRAVLEPEDARRLILLNAFPDILDVMLDAAGAGGQATA